MDKMPHVKYNRPRNHHRDPHVSTPEKFGGLQGQPRFGQDALSAHSSVDIAMEDAEVTPRLLSDFDLDLTGDQEMQAYRMLKDWICWRYVTRAFGQFVETIRVIKMSVKSLGRSRWAKPKDEDHWVCHQVWAKPGSEDRWIRMLGNLMHLGD